MVGISLQQLVILECPVCQQWLDQESDFEKFLDIILTQEKYSVCCCCLQSFGQGNWTPGYKRRWTRYFHKHYQ